MNRKLAGLCHLALWAYLFLSPLTFWRGMSFNLEFYLMTCLQPLLLVVVFYLNYLVLTPKLFVAGKHRYDLLINVVMLTSFGIFIHFWMDYINHLYLPGYRPVVNPIATLSYIARDTLNLAIFASGATALALARRWYTADQKLKEAEAARVQAELSNMRNQINPHFLLNTLNNIYALTAFDTVKAQEAIQELSRMLRHILYDYQKPMVVLSDEVEFLQNYVNLMRIRLPESVDVSFKSTVTNPQIEVAPMLFISLVENAFKHGVSSTEPSSISIKLAATETEIRCDITNTNFPKTSNDRSGHGIGLQQVEQRLNSIYQGKYSWTHGINESDGLYHSEIVLKK